MKKILTFMLVFAMALILMACGMHRQIAEEKLPSTTGNSAVEQPDLKTLHKQGDDYARAGQYDKRKP